MKSIGDIMKEIDGANYSEQYEILEKWQNDQRRECAKIYRTSSRNYQSQYIPLIEWAIGNVGKGEKEDE
jgi:hypothetical protein